MRESLSPCPGRDEPLAASHPRCAPGCLGTSVTDRSVPFVGYVWLIITVMRKAIPVSPWPAMNSRPNMVENHSGWIDMIQSMDMNVVVKPQKMMPGPARALMVPWTASWPSVSSRREARL